MKIIGLIILSFVSLVLNLTAQEHGVYQAPLEVAVQVQKLIALMDNRYNVPSSTDYEATGENDPFDIEFDRLAAMLDKEMVEKALPYEGTNIRAKLVVLADAKRKNPKYFKEVRNNIFKEKGDTADDFFRKRKEITEEDVAKHPDEYRKAWEYYVLRPTGYTMDWRRIETMSERLRLIGDDRSLIVLEYLYRLIQPSEIKNYDETTTIWIRRALREWYTPEGFILYLKLDTLWKNYIKNTRPNDYKKSDIKKIRASYLKDKYLSVISKIDVNRLTPEERWWIEPALEKIEENKRIPSKNKAN